MSDENRVSLFDLVMGLSRAVDLISPLVTDHHRHVAYMAFRLSQAMNRPPEEQGRMFLAGALHDIGALSLRERIDSLHFEIDQPHRHAELGYRLLSMFEPFRPAAEIVRFHHVPWAHGDGMVFRGSPVLRESHVLHLADRIAVLMNRKQEILGQALGISSTILAQSGSRFAPEIVDVFSELARNESFWLEAASPPPSTDRMYPIELPVVQLDSDDLLRLSRLFARVIDFRSRVTATHSDGVAACAEALAAWTGLSPADCRKMRIAGYLHDLGKLLVPSEVLEKPVGLSDREFNMIRAHTFFTYRTLQPIPAMDTINEWSSFHHERIDGSGYPFHLKGSDIPKGSRIMAVADVFTAVTEDRPYRKGLSREPVLEILNQMAQSSSLDSEIVALVHVHFDELDALRRQVQEDTLREYDAFDRDTPPLS